MLSLCMVTALNSVAYAFQSTLLGVECIEVHHRLGADAGHSFFWPQRFFLAAFDYPDPVDFRKRQVKDRTLESLCEAWQLPTTSFVHGSRQLEALRTTCLNSGMLFAWLFHIFMCGLKAKRSDRSMKSVGVLSQASAFISEGLQHCGEGPSITVLGVHFEVQQGGCLCLSDLSSVYPEWLQEWRDLWKHADMAACNRPPCDNEKVPLVDVIPFLEARIFYSTELLNCQHWLVSFRNSLLQVAAFLFEVHVAHRLDNATNTRKLSPVQLWTKAGRKQQASALVKQKLLDIAFRRYGSNSTIIDVLTDGHKGYNSVVQRIGNRMYLEQARCGMNSHNSFAVHWDVAFYGGISCNIGFLMETRGFRGCYLKPTVRLQTDLPFFPFLWFRKQGVETYFERFCFWRKGRHDRF